MEIDPKTGLPVEAMSWEELTRKDQRIKITTEKKRYGKMVTQISGFDKQTDVKNIAKALKNELACGGTFKGDMVELQGDHKKKVKPILIKLGFEEEGIED